VTGLRLRQNLKLQDTDLESLSYQGFGVAMQLLNHREDAMDVVQESLRKLVHGGQFNGKLGTHRSWFLKVVRNGSLDVLRRRKPHDPEALAHQADNNKTPDVATERNELTVLPSVSFLPPISSSGQLTVPAWLSVVSPCSTT